ncbi:MAG: hypothetical protein OEQ18_12230, partial [Gammaproteobacteria bacterium]|nr:hypothetical protein [Gammaproteobacteria bacterium]
MATVPSSHAGELPARARVLSGIPLAVFFVALLAALIHIAPFLRAYEVTPPGWSFTWTLNVSPDYMTYSVFARRAQLTGILIDNRFIDIENEPHIPMLFYYLVGKIAALTGATPEFVSAVSGSLFAFLLAVLLFVTVRHFMGTDYRTWWVYVVILVGGGLGMHLKTLSKTPYLRDNFIVDRVVTDGLKHAVVFENYRNHYVFNTLFDSHFLFFLLLALLAVLAFYFALLKFSTPRATLAAFAFGFVTLAHIYDGVTLLAIAYGVTFLCWRKGVAVRAAVFATSSCTVAVAAVVLWQLLLYKHSGMPVPDWRADSVLVSELLLAYPVAWFLIVWGLRDYWDKAGVNECFLLGWVLGCTALTLSGPFYPYSDRGTLTLQVALYLVAGGIFFARFARVSWPLVIVAVLILGVSAPRHTWRWWTTHSEFNATLPSRFLSDEHLELIAVLEREATDKDLLMLDKTKPPWLTDDLWLAPTFRGKVYSAHYALSVGYDKKREEITRFFESDNPDEQMRYLREHGIDFLYVDAKRMPERFARLPGLMILKAASFGTLFKVVPESAGG